MNTKRILIVDDEKHVRDLLQKILQKEGYTVFTACDGQEGLELIGREQVYIIISDIKMPGMSGIELLHRVKAVDPDIGFILITAFATMETAIEAIRMGAQDYITKPFDIEEILSAVQRLTLQMEKGNNLHPNDALSQEEVKAQSKSAAMQEVLRLSKQVAGAESTVLITGETGTGKEVISSLIHKWSCRKDKPFIKVNCGAIPENLLESELFGYEKGAFTGAVTTKPGRFEIAQGGTIFLDEIGDISPAIQVKLLRVLQEKTFERLGGLRSITADVRVIAATNKKLMEMMMTGHFREDLYYRLNVVPIHLPALRERKEDIDDLVAYFLRKAAKVSKNRHPKTMSEEAMQILKAYRWPGNIRELENIVERCVVVTPGQVIEAHCLSPELGGGSCPEAGRSRDKPLSDAVDNREKEIILRAILDNDGNKTKAALDLGISRRSLHRKLQKYDITI